MIVCSITSPATPWYSTRVKPVSGEQNPGCCLVPPSSIVEKATNKAPVDVVRANRPRGSVHMDSHLLLVRDGAPRLNRYFEYAAGVIPSRSRVPDQISTKPISPRKPLSLRLRDPMRSGP